MVIDHGQISAAKSVGRPDRLPELAAAGRLEPPHVTLSGDILRSVGGSMLRFLAAGPYWLPPRQSRTCGAGSRRMAAQQGLVESAP